MILRIGFLLVALAIRPASAGLLDLSQHQWGFVGEAGVLWTPLMDIRGYQQSDATRGWNATSPTVRAEAWLTRPDALNLGIVAQPVVLNFRGTIQNPLAYRGQNFVAGEPGRLRYQFNSVRFTANYDVWAGEATELRLGASLIARYAEVDLSSPSARFKRTNFLVVPLLNLEVSQRLDERFRLVARADFFPATRNAGFYDIFAGVRYGLEHGRAIELGSRTLFGGYLPEKTNDFGNRIVFQGVVARFVF
ncbi:hypothetical protein [Sediminicoccus sp. KRV36]|uniref:hypothetical protein n=1 Tax=Sediminicoccus sp. KRV36 TaxID=3133721 RepID=UPI00200C1BB8|nr:hypothetical protein [Sediminicoccus rosea]UPY37922.1 hypothetical protein LHU95_04280 [Sediminicoccus rosea]